MNNRSKCKEIKESEFPKKGNVKEDREKYRQDNRKKIKDDIEKYHQTVK